MVHSVPELGEDLPRALHDLGALLGLRGLRLLLLLCLLCLLGLCLPLPWLLLLVMMVMVLLLLLLLDLLAVAAVPGAGLGPIPLRGPLHNRDAHGLCAPVANTHWLGADAGNREREKKVCMNE